MDLEAYLRSELKYAEWNDKWIHYVDGPTVQFYTLELRLPVPVDDRDKSPEAALARFLAEVKRRRK